MLKKDVLIGLFILVVLVGAVYWFKRPKSQITLPSTNTSTKEVENKIKNSFNVTIPEDVDKTDLKDVSGGDGSALTTRKFENGVFTLTILADLPDLSPKAFYQGWLVQGNTYIPLGELKLAKGGYMLEFQSKTDYSSYKEVLVTLEKTRDNKPEERILDGSF